MGRDGQPKHRQHARDLRRQAASQPPYDRVLIVCEGTKTEPQYLNEIRAELRIPTAHVRVLPGGLGTEPMQLVEFAMRLFKQGSRKESIDPRRFDQLFVVFDRDEHHTYSDALARVTALNGQLTNDEHQKVPFRAVVSVPCFELWLLLHFEDVQAPLHRSEACERLRQHLIGYDKGQLGVWAATKGLLATATQRARMRAKLADRHSAHEPYTDVGDLVALLTQLKGKSSS